MWMLSFKTERVNKVYVHNREEIMRDLSNVISDEKKKIACSFNNRTPSWCSLVKMVFIIWKYYQGDDFIQK